LNLRPFIYLNNIDGYGLGFAIRVIFGGNSPGRVAILAGDYAAHYVGEDVHQFVIFTFKSNYYEEKNNKSYLIYYGFYFIFYYFFRLGAF
jgi:hypothetical protein